MDPYPSSEKPIIGGVVPGQSDVLARPSASSEPPASQTAGGPDVLVGQWRAVPGGFSSSSAASPYATGHRLSSDETTYPSRFTGGVGPEVMEGKWKLVRSENFDEYLKAVGANIVKRNMMPLENYCVHFEKVGEETWKMTISTTMKRIELTFKLDGSEVEEFTDDGRKVLTKMTWDNGKLTQKRFAQEEGEKGGTLTRIFRGDNMELVAQVDGVTCHRYYTKDEHCM